jgi:hypothetical protein
MKALSSLVAQFWSKCRKPRERAGPEETRLRTNLYYIFLARRTLVTRVLVPSSWKTSSVVDSVHRRRTRIHRLMASGAGAGPFRAGTTLWLMGILLCFAATLPTGAFVPKITKPEESASPK